MVAGYPAANIARNVNIAGGVRAFFKRRDVDTYFASLGDIGDVSLEPLANFFSHLSTYDGRQAEAKRILSERGLTLNLTLNEINVPNLRHAFLANAEETGSINIPSTATPQQTSSGTWVLPEASADVGDVLEVRSEDGDTLYTVTTDYTVSGNTITNAGTGGSIATTEGLKVHVLYEVIMGAANTRKIEILQDTEIEGQAQFHVRNQDGGLAQIIELDSVLVAPTGAISVAADSPQQVPITMTAQILSGNFGRVYVRDIA